MTQDLSNSIMGSTVCLVAICAVLRLWQFEKPKGFSFWLHIATLFSILWYALIIWGIAP